MRPPEPTDPLIKYEEQQTREQETYLRDMNDYRFKEAHMNELKIDSENIGPLPAMSLALKGYGIHVLSAPNGSGKSIFMAACQDLARGTGKPPLRRGAEKGFIAGMGAKITISEKSTRHTGEFQVLNLEGRFDLSQIVDPGLKDQTAADARRIKALLQVQGVTGGRDVWLSHPAYDETILMGTVSMETLELPDIVEQAAIIARNFQQKAREWEKFAQDDERRADAIAEAIVEPAEGVETDLDVLTQRVQEASDEWGRLSLRVGTFTGLKENADKAREELARWEVGEESKITVEEAELAVSDVEKRHGVLELEILELEKLLAEKKKTFAAVEQEYGNAIHLRERTKTVQSRIAKCRQDIETEAAFEVPTPEQLAAAKERWDQAKHHLTIGARGRDAVAQRTNLEVFRTSAAERRAQAEQYRQAADATGDVLVSSLPPGMFTVRKMRLYIQHPRRKELVAFHELSHSERWNRAVKVGAIAVGTDGLLVISQEAWEGMDVWTRKELNELVKELQVYLLTAEATRDEHDGEGMVVREFGAQEQEESD